MSHHFLQDLHADVVQRIYLYQLLSSSLSLRAPDALWPCVIPSAASGSLSLYLHGFAKGWGWLCKLTV